MKTYARIEDVGKPQCVGTLSVNGIEVGPDEMRMAAVKQNSPRKHITEEMLWCAIRKNPFVCTFVADIMTPDMWMEVVKAEGMLIRRVPINLRTPEMCMEAVNGNTKALMHCKQTRELVDFACKNDPQAYKYVSTELRTPEMWDKLVSETGKYLAYVPYNLRTPELCRKAIENDPFAIEYAIQTPELVQLAYSKNKNVLEHIDHELITHNMASIPRTIDPKAKNGFVNYEYTTEYLTRNTPHEFITPEFCIESVKYNVPSITFVPDGYRSKEMILEAIKNDPLSLTYIHPDELTPEMMMEAVSRDWRALRNISYYKRTAAMCVEAIKQNPIEAIKLTPCTLHTDYSIARSLMQAIKDNPNVIQYIHPPTTEMCREAISRDWKTIQYVPQTDQLCIQAIDKNPFAIKLCKQTPALIDYILKKYPHMFQYIDDEFKTHENCLKIISDYGYAIFYIPESMRSPGLIRIALANNPDLLKMMDKKMLNSIF